MIPTVLHELLYLCLSSCLRGECFLHFFAFMTLCQHNFICPGVFFDGVCSLSAVCFLIPFPCYLPYLGIDPFGLLILPEHGEFSTDLPFARGPGRRWSKQRSRTKGRFLLLSRASHTSLCTWWDHSLGFTWTSSGNRGQPCEETIVGAPPSSPQ